MSLPLLPVGRFAQLTGLTVRALRLYDELGVLRPETVDGSSRYRYYTTDQCERAVLIARLRRVDMPLEEIERYLNGTRIDREQALACHRERLRARAAAATEAIRLLDQMKKELLMAVELQSGRVTSMVLKTLRDQPVLHIRAEWTFEECAGGAPGRDIEEVFQALKRQGLVQAGPPYCIWNLASDQNPMHAEVGIPVNRAGVAQGHVEPAVLPGGDVASVLFTGPYQNVRAAYRQLFAEMESAGLIPNGDPREIYLTSPQATPNPEDYFTEVVWPIKG